MMDGVQQLIKPKRTTRSVDVDPDVQPDSADTLVPLMLARAKQNDVEEWTHPAGEEKIGFIHFPFTIPAHSTWTSTTA